MEQSVENGLIKTPDNQLDADLAELLAMDESEGDEVIETIMASDEDIEAVVAEVELQEAKAEAYASQEPEKAPAAAAEPSAEPTAKKAVKRTRVSTTGMKTSEAVKTVLGRDWESALALEVGDIDDFGNIDHAAVEKHLLSLDGLAKKQSMKAVNVFKWLNSRVKLESYVDQAMKLLIEKGEMSSADLRSKYLAHPYSVGTANSQTNQIMHLLPALRIAKSGGRSLVLNEDSTIVMHYKTVNNIA